MNEKKTAGCSILAIILHKLHAVHVFNNKLVSPTKTLMLTGMVVIYFLQGPISLQTDNEL